MLPAGPISCAPPRRSLQQQSVVSLGTPSQHTEAGHGGSGIAGQASPCASPPTGLASAGAAGGGCTDGVGGIFGGGGSFKLFDVCIDFVEEHTYEQQEAEEEAAQLAPGCAGAPAAADDAEAQAAAPPTPLPQVAA